nr:nucleolar protein 58-like [Cherax quadricarinatus]
MALIEIGAIGARINNCTGPISTLQTELFAILLVATQCVHVSKILAMYKPRENLENFETPEKASKIVQLQEFKKFSDSADALQAGVALNEGKLCKPLKKLLKKVFSQVSNEELMVWDTKLGISIKENFDVQCVTNNTVSELMRCIKSQVEALIPGLQEKNWLLCH